MKHHSTSASDRSHRASPKKPKEFNIPTLGSCSRGWFILGPILKGLNHPPFEAIASCSLKLLTWKTLLLLGITSARWVSELVAFSMAKELCHFHHYKVVIHIDPAFLPKVNSLFHRTQGITLPLFCTNPAHPREWHIHRASSCYLERIASFWQIETLFVSYKIH